VIFYYLENFIGLCVLSVLWL